MSTRSFHLTRRALPILLTGMMAGASGAAEPGGGGAERADGARRSAGLGLIVADSEYAGEGTRALLVPILGYEGERVFLRGVGGGVHLLRGKQFGLAATLGARLYGWEASDLGINELAARGVDRAHLQDRDPGLDAGLATSWTGVAGKLELELKSDLDGGDKGSEAVLGYSLPFPVGAAIVVPGLAVSAWSGARADYYYGTLAAEVARGAPAYRPGSVLMPRATLAAIYPYAQWQWVAALEYRALPDAVRDSPLLQRDARGTASLFVALSRRF